MVNLTNEYATNRPPRRARAPTREGNPVFVVEVSALMAGNLTKKVAVVNKVCAVFCGIINERGGYRNLHHPNAGQKSMSNTNLIDAIREYVRIHNPRCGDNAWIGGKQWVFVRRDETRPLRHAFSSTDNHGRRISNCVFVDEMNIDSFSYISERVPPLFLNAVFLENVTFSNVNFAIEFTLQIEAADTAKISFVRCHISNKLKIRSPEHRCYEYAQRNKVKVDWLLFADCSMASGETGKVPYLRVGFLNADIFSLQNLRIPANAELNIGDCRFENFQISNVRNLGKLKLYKINILSNEKATNKFRLDNTSIGDADFQSVDFSSFRERLIFDNILTGLKYSNVLLEPKNSEIKVGQYDDEEDEIIKKRDTYRSLKNVALNNNDNAHAFAFYAKEMKYHRKAVQYTDSRFSQERIILWFNYCSSNFGQYWLLPVGWIILFGVVGYIFLLSLLCLPVFDCDNWAKFFLFLSPIHKTEFIGHPGQWGFLAYTIDFLFRVVEGSLIYQAIQAFRRYTRNI